MAKNIYDLFNERKYGVDYLVEGYDFEEDGIEAYEDLQESANALEEITQEVLNESIELQSAYYLENLVIENMMFNNFDEDRIENVMMESVRDKFQAAKDRIQHWWKKMKEWFVGTFKAITNHFKSGEALVKQYGNKIDSAMAASHVKVKMHEYNDLLDVEGQVDVLIGAVKDAGKTALDKDDARTEILSAVGASDRKDVPEKVKKIFIKEENKEQVISSIHVGRAKHWAGNKKSILDGLKKYQKKVDESFRNALQKLQEQERKASAEDADTASKLVANFSFALGVKNTILSTYTALTKKACKDHEMVIRRALNAPANKRAAKKAAKAADNNYEAESFVPNFDFDEPEFY